jgi:hypothetical protein
VLLVHRQVVRQPRPLGEEEAGDRLARDVHEPRDLPSHGRLDRVERRHHVVAEDDVRRVVRRIRDRGGVDDGVLPADDRERVAGVG